MRKKEELIKLARMCWKDMVENAPNLMIPLINEMLDCNIPLKAAVKLQSKVESVEEESEGLCVDVAELFITDQKYELVCVCSGDEIMLLSCMDRTPKSPENAYGRVAHFILLEESEVWSPDSMKNNYVSIKAKGILDYSINELLEKKLWFLLPFLLLNFVKNKDLYDKDYSLRVRASNQMTYLLGNLLTEVAEGNVEEYVAVIVFKQCRRILDNFTN